MGRRVPPAKRVGTEARAQIDRLANVVQGSGREAHIVPAQRCESAVSAYP